MEDISTAQSPYASVNQKMEKRQHKYSKSLYYGANEHQQLTTTKSSQSITDFNHQKHKITTGGGTAVPYFFHDKIALKTEEFPESEKLSFIKPVIQPNPSLKNAAIIFGPRNSCGDENNDSQVSKLKKKKSCSSIMKKT